MGHTDISMAMKGMAIEEDSEAALRLMRKAALRWMHLELYSAMATWRRHAAAATHEAGARNSSMAARMGAAHEAEAPQLIHINIAGWRSTSLDGERHDVTISSAARVSELAAATKTVYHAKGSERVQLWYEGRQLSHGSLDDIGIGDGAEVQLIIEEDSEAALRLMRKAALRWMHLELYSAMTTWRRHAAAATHEAGARHSSMAARMGAAHEAEAPQLIHINISTLGGERHDVTISSAARVSELAAA